LHYLQHPYNYFTKRFISLAQGGK